MTSKRPVSHAKISSIATPTRASTSSTRSPRISLTSSRMGVKISTVHSEGLRLSDKGLNQKQVTEEHGQKRLLLIWVVYGERSLQAPVMIVCKDWGLSSRTRTSALAATTTSGEEVGAAEQKRPKARVAKTDRMKERIVIG